MLNAIQGLTRFERPSTVARNVPVSQGSTVSFSAPADSVRFSSNTPRVGTDAEGDALLTKLTARMNEATDWKVVTLTDKWGQTAAGDDFIFKLDGTMYTYRGVCRSDSLPEGLKYGAELIADGPEGKKTYALSHRFGNRQGEMKTYEKHFKAIASVAYPAIANEAVARLTANIDSFRNLGLYSHNNSEVISFEAGDRRYVFHRPDPAKEQPSLDETVALPPEEEIQKAYEAIVAFHKEDGHEENIKPYPEFRKAHLGQWLRRPNHSLTPTQINTIQQMLAPHVEKALQSQFGIGPGRDVTPVLLKMADQVKVDHAGNPEHAAVTASEDGPERELEIKDKLSWNFGIVNDKPCAIEIHRRKTYRETDLEYSFTVRHGDSYILNLPISKAEDKKLVDAMITWGVATSRLHMTEYFAKLTSQPALFELFKPSEKRTANQKQEQAEDLSAKNEAFEALQTLLTPQN